MTAADVRSFVDRAQAAWNGGDRAGYTGLYANDMVITAPGGMRLEGRAGADAFYDTWKAAFPDSRVDIKNVIADDRSACVEAVFVGTHTGTLVTPMGDISATGKKVAVPFTHLFTLNGQGLTATARLYFDTSELMIQLGLMPAPATA